MNHSTPTIGGPDYMDALTPSLPPVVDRAAFQTEIDALRTREKALTRESDAIAAARRRLSMVEVDATAELIGPNGSTTLLDAFEGRRQLIAYYYMWNEGQPASEQCEGCTWCNNAVSELAYLHSRDITYAVFAQGPYAESKRYHDFMGWEMPWYSVTPSLDTLLVDRHIGMMHLICYVREGDRVFETWWTTYRGVQVMDNSYSLMDLTVFGRQEQHQDSPAGWPRRPADWNLLELNGRPMTQWSRLEAGRSDDLGNGEHHESTSSGATCCH